ncbi:hypothetical protein [Capnocytophaga stomatis]|uniref:Uncharacterized protein n=1 Tax=Capnocytophaga stomatis TaxID=1848904 RepID=A0ABW8QBF3_9FLAO
MAKQKIKKQKSVPIIEKFDTPLEYFSIFQYLVFAGTYLYFWLFADISDAYKVYSLAMLIIFEFIMVHSGIFMAVIPAKYSLLIFFPFYGIFALVFNLSLNLGDNQILILYLVTVFHRMRFAFFNTDKDIKNRLILFSVLGALAYFILTFFSLIFSPILPYFALDEFFFNSDAYQNVKKMKGAFVDTPHEAIIFGFLYYLALAFINFRLLRIAKGK